MRRDAATGDPWAPSLVRASADPDGEGEDRAHPEDHARARGSGVRLRRGRRRLVARRVRAGDVAALAGADDEAQRELLGDVLPARAPRRLRGEEERAALDA